MDSRQRQAMTCQTSLLQGVSTHQMMHYHTQPALSHSAPVTAVADMPSAAVVADVIPMSVSHPAQSLLFHMPAANVGIIPGNDPEHSSTTSSVVSATPTDTLARFPPRTSRR